MYEQYLWRKDLMRDYRRQADYMRSPEWDQIFSEKIQRCGEACQAASTDAPDPSPGGRQRTAGHVSNLTSSHSEALITRHVFISKHID